MNFMSLHRRHRLRIAVLVIFSLLFQQIAMAAFVCAPLRMPTDPAAMAEDCADMDMGMDMNMDMNMERANTSADICAAVCSPDWTLGADHVALRVPPLSLPLPEFAALLVSPVMHVVLHANVPLRRSDPPPRLRYCSLQI